LQQPLLNRALTGNRSDWLGTIWLLLWLQVMAMTNLVAAYQANDIREFEKILQMNK
jgi:hypothetical protein